MSATCTFAKGGRCEAVATHYVVRDWREPAWWVDNHGGLIEYVNGREFRGGRGLCCFGAEFCQPHAEAVCAARNAQATPQASAPTKGKRKAA